MGVAITVIPQASQESLQDVTSLMHAALCSNAGIPVDILKVVKGTSSTNTIQNILIDTAIDSVLNMVKCIKANNNRYLIADK